MHTPTHKEISRHAEKIWQDQGCPSGCDDDIWLEAEWQLSAKSCPPQPELPTASTLNEIHHDQIQTEQAADQKKKARAPQRPVKSAPKPATPQSGKPLWSKPHSQ